MSQNFDRTMEILNGNSAKTMLRLDRFVAQLPADVANHYAPRPTRFHAHVLFMMFGVRNTDAPTDRSGKLKAVRIWEFAA
jgi:hypothetical protein